MTGGAGVARPRTVAGEGAPRLRAAAAVLAQVGEAPAGEKEEGQNETKLNVQLQLQSRRRRNAEQLVMLIKASTQLCVSQSTGATGGILRLDYYLIAANSG